MSRPDPAITAHLLEAMPKQAEALPGKAPMAHPGKTHPDGGHPMARLTAGKKQAGPGHTRSSNRGK